MGGREGTLSEHGPLPKEIMLTMWTVSTLIILDDGKNEKKNSRDEDGCQIPLSFIPDDPNH